MSSAKALVRQQVDYWTKHADAIIGSFSTDGVGRWDVLPVSPISIDVRRWTARSNYSKNDGRNGPVVIAHAPNHRAIKGTEFLLNAIDCLRQEGLSVELILLERLPNETVREVFQQQADILAEQFIVTGFGLNGIEGMASGLPVLANLDETPALRALRRYSYLDECPILSTVPEQLADHLRILITNPNLRQQLGRAGRAYVEKYHSDTAAIFLFESLYERIWHRNAVDLLNLYHPLTSSYVRDGGRIVHPLVDSRLPAQQTSVDGVVS